MAKSAPERGGFCYTDCKKMLMGINQYLQVIQCVLTKACLWTLAALGAGFLAYFLLRVLSDALRKWLRLGLLGMVVTGCGLGVFCVYGSLKRGTDSGVLHISSPQALSPFAVDSPGVTRPAGSVGFSFHDFKIYDETFRFAVGLPSGMTFVGNRIVLQGKSDLTSTNWLDIVGLNVSGASSSACFEVRKSFLPASLMESSFFFRLVALESTGGIDSQDSDGDGLPDTLETWLGTCPTTADTDADGLPDGWEFDNGFDPLSPPGEGEGSLDSDDDGLTNADEYAQATDPHHADSDDDGVSDGDEVAQGTSPTDSTDVMPLRWFRLTGDLAAGIPKRRIETITIPRGMSAYVGIFLYSTEYPEIIFADWGDDYDDRLLWDVTAPGHEGLSGIAHVSQEVEAWNDAWGQRLGNYEPVSFKTGRLFTAPPEQDLQVRIDLAAMNVLDGAWPSTIFAGVFPLKVIQANYPQIGDNGGTTDMGGPTRRELIRSGKAAYITGAPAAPQLTVQLQGLPTWLPVTWSGSLASERIERSRYGRDVKALVPQLLDGSAAYNICEALSNEIVGGTNTVTASIQNQSSLEYVFPIRGMNPLDSVVRSYIESHSPEGTSGYSWKIAVHESVQGQYIYNQFNASEGIRTTPNFGAPDGWGIAQIDRSGEVDAQGNQRSASTAEVYDWHANTQAMCDKLDYALQKAREFIGYYRDSYSSMADWTEPPPIAVGTRTITAEAWAVMTIYNGVAGIPGQTTPTHPRTFYSPVEYVGHGEWRFHSNTTNPDYVQQVLSDSSGVEGVD